MSFANTLVSVGSRAALQFQKHAPAIITVGAVLSGVGAIGTAIKQTTTVGPCFAPWIERRDKVAEFDKLVEEITEDWNRRHEDDENPPPLPENDYTPELRNKDILITGVQTGVNLVKHYALPLALEALSVACILTLYKVMNARYTAVVAAYTGLQGMFERYKDEVKEKYGEDEEKEITALAVDKNIETIHDISSGEVKRKENTSSQYARFFDETNIYFRRGPGENLAFLKRCQATANQMLRMNGCLFLNEIYDMLGFERTKAGSIVGWVYDPRGDMNQVDLGFWQPDDERRRKFLNGWADCVLLDFNVDGVIFDLI